MARTETEILNEARARGPACFKIGVFVLDAIVREPQPSRPHRCRADS